MKKYLLIALIIISASCSNKKEDKMSNHLPFEGTWTRSFSMGEGVEAKITYAIYNDSILYTMNGPMNMTYSIKKDTFLIKENKWIGNKNGTPYVVFVKNKTNESITLLKMKLNSKEQGLKMPFPSDSARSKFSSWNTYTRK